MIGYDTIGKLSIAFPRSFINQNGEFIAHEKANEYFILRNCEDELDVKCKVLEWLSYGAHARQPFDSIARNDKFHNFMLKGINEFLETEFTAADIELIYDQLGNCVNHTLTLQFVKSGYDMTLLERTR